MILPLLLLGCIEADVRLGGWDRDAQATALRESPAPWAWRHRGYVEKWAVVGGWRTGVRSAALGRLGAIGDAEACRFLLEELDGPNAEIARSAMQSAGIDDDCARVDAP